MKAEKKHHQKRQKRQPRGQVILHEDRDIIVVDKAPGLLTMGTNREKVQTAYYRLTNYVRKGNPKSRQRIYIVHRLDREVSGVLVFARSVEAKNVLQERWHLAKKLYLALVRGVPRQPEGTFSSYLVENGVHNVHSTRDPKRGRLSHTAYKTLGHSEGISLLEIHLLTGRKHQIRVHLAENGLPIIGDTKYGETGPSSRRSRRRPSRERRLALHAKSIAFAHPYTGEPCFFEARTPHILSRIPRFHSPLPDGRFLRKGEPPSSNASEPEESPSETS